MMHVKYLLIASMFLLMNCTPEEKLFKRSVFDPTYVPCDFDTISLVSTQANFYKRNVFSYQPDTVNQEAIHQVPIKLSRKYSEFNIVLSDERNINIDSLTRASFSNLIKSSLNTKSDKFHLAVIINDSSSTYRPKHRFGIFTIQYGHTRSFMNNTLWDLPFYPLQLLTLNILRFRWNKAYSNWTILMYDFEKNKPVYIGSNSRYLIPNDSISINKHVEVLLNKVQDKYKKVNDCKSE